MSFDTDLSSFGGGSNPSPPILHSDEEVRMRFPEKGEVAVGHRGPIPRRKAYGFVKFVERRKHLLRAKAAYSFSDKLLRRLRKYGCKILLVAETDTGRVYEFHERQFTQSVPKQYNPNADEDPQSFVKCSESYGQYEDWAESVMIR